MYVYRIIYFQGSVSTYTNYMYFEISVTICYFNSDYFSYVFKCFYCLNWKL